MIVNNGAAVRPQREAQRLYAQGICSPEYLHFFDLLNVKRYRVQHPSICRVNTALKIGMVFREW